MKYLLGFIAITALSGCVTPLSQSNLYWGNYSQTLYQVKKNPGEASNSEHEKELLSIVEQSKKRNLNVPPGVYAELGLFAMDRADSAAAINFFRMEQATYPEGSVLMERILEAEADNKL